MKKLKKLKQIDGKLDAPEKEKDEQPEAKKKAWTLDQVLGNTGTSKYKTLDEQEYRATLDSMNKSDLQTHATKHNLIPIDDTPRLKKRLVGEFRKHIALYQPKPVLVQVKASKEALRILADGR